jgi:hypothetical protein
MNPDIMYSLRLTNLLRLPIVVQEVISSMHLAPVAPTFIRKPNYKKFKKTADNDDNWRRELLSDIKATVRNKDDPDYEAVIGIINRVVSSNVKEKTDAIFDILAKRDDKFRMRVVNLMFDRGVNASFYAKVMADVFEHLTEKNSCIRDDLQVFCSMDTFAKMFDDTELVVFPDMNESDFEDKVCIWTKQKERRRGFGIFATELYMRGLVADTLINDALTSVIQDLEGNIRKPANKILSESVDQIVTFMSEISKLTIMSIIQDEARKILAIPRLECCNLNMRSRFRLEDCIQ